MPSTSPVQTTSRLLVVQKFGDQVVATHEVKPGELMRIKLVNRGDVEIIDPLTSKAPPQVTVKRQGNDLWVKAKHADDTESEAVLEDYYSDDHRLIGLNDAENYVEYVPSSDDFATVALLSDGVESLQVLGVEAEVGALVGLGIGEWLVSGAAIVGLWPDGFNKFPLSTKPAAPNAGLAPDSDTGLKGDGITSDRTPTLTGSGAQPGGTITVKLPDGTQLTTLVQSDGTWSLTPTTSLANGSNEIVITQTSVGGETSTGTTLTVLIQDPTAPSVSVPEALGGINALEASDGVDVIVALPGNAGEGDVITVSVGTGPVVTHTVTPADLALGSVTLLIPSTTLALVPDGQVSITTSYIDINGTPAPDVTTTVNFDITTPTQTITIDSISFDSGTSNDFITNDNDGLTINATLSAALGTGEVLEYFNGVTWATVAVTGITGTAISFTDASLISSQTIKFRVSDGANYGSEASKLVTIDTAAPAQTITIDSINLDSGTSNDFITNDNDGLTINATLSAALGSGQVLEYFNGTTWSNVAASGISGTAISFADTSLTTSQTIKFRVSDGANYSSEVRQLVTIDTSAPAQTITIDSISFDSGTSNDFITNDNDGLTINATLSAALGTGEVLEYFNGVTWATVAATGITGTAISFTDASLISSQTIKFRVSDGASYGAEASKLITIDTSAPTQTITIDSISFDSGTSNDFITNDNDGLTINATLSAALGTGEVLEYFNGTTWANVAASSIVGTAISFDDASLTSSKTIKFRVSDGANYSAEVSQLVTIDTSAPAQTITIDSISFDSGTSNDFITNDNDGLTINATLSAVLGSGQVLEYFNGTTWATVSASSIVGTAISFDDASLTSSQTIKLRVSDGASYGAEASKLVTIDTATPTQTITIDSISFDSATPNDFITNDSDGLTINATLSTALGTGQVLEYFNGTNWATVAASSIVGTAISFDDASLTSSQTIKFRVSDGANYGEEVSKLITIDTSASMKTIIINSISFDTGTSNDFITSDSDGLTVNATLSAALVSGETLEYHNGTTWATVAASSITGTAISFVDASLISSRTIKFRVNDGASYGAEASKLVTIDTATPTQTITIGSISLDSGTPNDFITNDNDGLTINATLSAALVGGETLEYFNGVTWATVAAGNISGTAISLTDATLTSSQTIKFRVSDGANYGTEATKLITIDTSAPTQTITIDSISLDSGTSNDFITNDNDGLTINATLSAALGTGQVLEYFNGTTWANVAASSITGTAISFDDASLTSSKTIKFRVSDGANYGAEATKLITIDITIPDATSTFAAINTDTGLFNNDFVTKFRNLTLDFTTDQALNTGAGEKVQMNLDGAGWVDVTQQITGANLWPTWRHNNAVNNLTAGVHNVLTRVVDRAGNIRDGVGRDFYVDRTAATATATISAITDDNGTPNDFITNDQNLSISGINDLLNTGTYTKERVQLSLNGGTSWLEVVQDTATTWHYNNEENTLLAGNYTFKTRVVDLSDNVASSTLVKTKAVIIDTSAPTQTVTIDSISLDSGTPGDFITNDSNGLTINATLSAALGTGDVVQYFNGTTWATVAASSISGTAITLTDATLTSSRTIKFRISDGANYGAEVSKLITIDTSAPTQTITIDSISFDSGTSNDFITNDNDGLTINATLSAALDTGEVLEYFNGTTWANVAASSIVGTAISFDDASLTSSKTIKFRVSDGANYGVEALKLITIDTLAPTQTITIDSISVDSGIDDFITNDNNGLTINATLSTVLGSGQVVEYFNGTTWANVTASSITGTAISFDDASLTSSKTIKFRVSDGANYGVEALKLITIDTSAPASPTVNVPESAGGISASEAEDGVGVNVTLPGNAEEGDVITVSINGSEPVIYTVTAGDLAGAGPHILTLTLPKTDIVLIADGSATITTTYKDKAGNSAPDVTTLVTLDLTPPGAMSVDVPEALNGGINLAEATDNGGVAVIITLPTNAGVGDLITLSIGGRPSQVSHLVTQDERNLGKVTLTLPTDEIIAVGNGTKDITTTYSDGVNPVATVNKTVNIDLTPPDAAVFFSHITSDTTADQSDDAAKHDYITFDETPLIFCVTDNPVGAGSKVQIDLGLGGGWLDMTLSDSVTWKYQSLTLIEGTYTFKTRIIDSSGNPNDVSKQDQKTVIIDRTRPVTTAAVTAITDTFGNITGTVANGGRTDDTSLDISGTLSASLVSGEETVYVYDGATLLGKATATGTTWTYSDTRLLSNGQTVSYTARVADTAGLQSIAGTAYKATIDTSAPAQTITIDSISFDSGTPNDFITNDNNGLTINATLSVALGTDDVLEYHNGTTWATVAAGNISGTAISLTDATLTSSRTIKFRVSDGANYGEEKSQLITIDTSAPTQTITIDNISLDSGTPSDFITNDNDGLTINATLSAVLVSGQVLEYFNGTTWANVAASSITGTAISFDDASLTSSKTIKFRVSDGANYGAEVIQLVTVDAVLPTATADITILYTDSYPSGSGGTSILTTNDQSIQIAGTVATTIDWADERVQIDLGDGVGWRFVSGYDQSNHTWYYDNTGSTMSFGLHLPKVRVIDKAGNAFTEQTANINIVPQVQSVTPFPTVTVNEGGTLVHTVTLSATSSAVVNVIFQLTGVTATVGTDTGTVEYNTGSGWQTATVTAGAFSVSVPASTVSFQVRVAARTDSIEEADETYTLSAKTADQATAASNTGTIVDITPPTAAVQITSISSDTAGAADGLTTDYKTSDTTLTVSGTIGTLVGNARLEISLNNTTWVTVTDVNVSNGTWIYVDPISHTSTGATTDLTYYVRVVGSAGQVGINTDQQGIDLVPPNTPTVTDDVGATTGTVSSGSITDDATPTFSGAAGSVAAGHTVNIYDVGTTLVGSVVAAADGSWTYTPTTDMAIGAHTITIKVKDANNTESVASAATTFTVNQTVNLTSTSPNQGLIINGAAAGDNTGISVSSAGDVNGDGYDDMIVGASGAQTSLGRAWLVFGQASQTTVDLNNLGSQGFLIDSGLSWPSYWAFLGFSVSAAGDVNGDGLSDLIVSAPLWKGISDANGGHVWTNPSGAAWVIYGKKDSSTVTVDTISSGQGFEIYQSNLPVWPSGTGGWYGTAGNYEVGFSVTKAGDVNGDGFDDVALGMPAPVSQFGVSGMGTTTVVFGGANHTTVDIASLTSSQGFQIIGTANDLRTGAAITGGGDINGDGLSDLIVSEPMYNNATGRTFVVFGKTNSTAVNLATIVSGGGGGFMVTGESANDYLGPVAALGDVNGDGLADFIVSAPYHDVGSATNAGRAYVVFGKADTTAVTLTNVVNGTGGFAINGIAASDAIGHGTTQFSMDASQAISSAGDINGDGLDDIIISSVTADSTTGVDSGQAYVVYGKASGTAINLSSVVSGAGGFVINGTGASQGIHSVSAAGDVNGDGFADLIVGQKTADPYGRVDAGAAYVLFGGKNGPLMQNAVDFTGTTAADTLTGTTASETFVAGEGNDTVTGNGGADVMYGGKGDDTFVLNADNIAQLSAGPVAVTNPLHVNAPTTQLARVDGGTGIDTLKLDGSGITLNFGAISNAMGAGSRLSSIERIDLTGSGNNTLSGLSLKDVLDMSGANLFNSGNGWTGLPASTTRQQLVIDGNTGDQVDLAVNSDWTPTGGTASNGGVIYDIYNHNSAQAQLLIAHSLAVI